MFPDSCFTWIVFREIPQTVKPSVVVTWGIPSLEKPRLCIFPSKLAWPKKKRIFFYTTVFKNNMHIMQYQYSSVFQLGVHELSRLLFWSIVAVLLLAFKIFSSHFFYFHTEVNDTNFWNLVPSAQHPILKWALLKVNARFGFTYKSKSGFSTVKIRKSKYI
jgi:hypothetical protein